MSIAPAASQTREDLQDPPWAFVSFVPEDLPWGDWLYFTLHGYPVPAALAVHATRYGFPLPETISAFPDPNDSVHSEHLSDAISAARFLIVVVSPHSAHAAETDEHIRAFKRGAGEERIIALVVEGKPASSTTLCVRSDNREWLPRWLQWRLGEDGFFKPADPTEPLIIDARPGYANLDDVMTSLLAVLLDVPREELELLDALTPGDGAAAEAAVMSARGELAAAALVNDDEEDKEVISGAGGGERPIEGSKDRRVPWALAVIALVLSLAIAGVYFLQSKSSKSAGKPGIETPAINPSDETAPIPVKATLPVPEVLPSTPIAALSEIPEPREAAAQPEIMEAPAVSVAQQEVVISPPAAGELQPSTQASPPVPDTQGEQEIAVRLEKEALLIRAESLMRQGSFQEAIAQYELALDAVQRFASLPKSRAAAKLEIARVCRTLGALQMRFASSSEALQTYERGRKILQKLKLSKDEAKERAALLGELEAGLRQVRREVE